MPVATTIALARPKSLAPGEPGSGLLGKSMVLFGVCSFLVLSVGCSNIGMSRSARMEGAPALTDAERELLEHTRFNLTVAVGARNNNPTHRDTLIRELKETGLFVNVVPGHVSPAQLVAVRTGGHFGNRTGLTFTLASRRAPQNTKTIRVNYYVSPFGSSGRDRQQYQDRLAVEVIKAVNELTGR